MSEFLIDIRDMELDGIYPMDLAPLVSSAGVLIVTVPRDENDKDEDEDEDRNEDKDKDKDKDEDEEEDENNSMPRLQADKSSTEDLLEGSESDSSEVGASRPEDEEYDQGFDPSSNIWPKEYQYPDSEPEDILDRLDQQVKDLLKIMEVKMGWPAVHRYEDDVILTEGLENISVMEDKLSKIVLSLKERIDRAQRTEARILQLITEDNLND